MTHQKLYEEILKDLKSRGEALSYRHPDYFKFENSKNNELYTFSLENLKSNDKVSINFKLIEDAVERTDKENTERIKLEDTSAAENFIYLLESLFTYN